MRKIATIALAIGLICVPAQGSIEADSARPPTGVWAFCASETEVGCIRKVVVTSPSGVVTEAKTTNDVSRARITLKVECTQSSAGCTSDLPSINCATTAANLSSLVVTATADEVPTHLQIELSTGTYQPRFAIGNGTRSLRVTTENGGNHVVSIETSVEEVPMALNSPIPVPDPTAPGYSPDDYMAKYGAWIASATADGGTNSASLTLKPTIDGSCNSKFDGVWLDFNSQGFSLGSLIGGPANCPPTMTCTGTVKLKLQLKAYSPHFKKARPNVDPEINPARIVVFLPNVLLASMGYYDTSTFSAESMAVTLKDGSLTTPTFVRSASGILVNLGVDHYSQPDPLVEIKVGSSMPPETPTTTITSTTGGSQFEVLRGRRISSTSLIKRAGWSSEVVTGVRVVVAPSSKSVCSFAAGGLKANKVGNCRVSISALPKSGKRISKSLMLRVVA